MKQTAVKWLVDEYFGGIENCTPDFIYHIKKAKEMEKEHIIEANENKMPFITGEEYYKETFKSE